MIYVAPLFRSRLGVPTLGRPLGSHRSVCLPQGVASPASVRVDGSRSRSGSRHLLNAGACSSLASRHPANVLESGMPVPPPYGAEHVRNRFVHVLPPLPP